jgi:hypothetical protein
MAKYRVKQGQQFGARKQHQAGAIVELTEQEAAGFLDKLELVDGTNASPKRADELTEGGLFVTPQSQTTPTTVATAFQNLRTAILAASDEELIAIPGIGEKSVEAVRAWARGETEQGSAPTGDADGAAAQKVEKEIEAEMGKDFAQTGTNPPTLAETDKPAPDATPTGSENPSVTTGTNDGTNSTLLTTGKDSAPKGTGKGKP